MSVPCSARRLSGAALVLLPGNGDPALDDGAAVRGSAQSCLSTTPSRARSRTELGTMGMPCSTTKSTRQRRRVVAPLPGGRGDLATAVIGSRWNAAASRKQITPVDRHRPARCMVGACRVRAVGVVIEAPRSPPDIGGRTPPGRNRAMPRSVRASSPTRGLASRRGSRAGGPKDGLQADVTFSGSCRKSRAARAVILTS